MRRIGIDFGTTNSTLVYYDEQRNEWRGFVIDNRREYIPSTIAYEINGKEILIGFDAINYRNDPNNYKVFDYYKPKLLGNYNGIADSSLKKTYLDIAKDYLSLLIAKYKEDNNLGDSKLEVVVLAVPNVVFSDSSLENLRKELESFLSTQSIEACLVSEPECACAYYIQNNSFDGNIAIVDYGGGTLDISMCRAKSGNPNGEPATVSFVRRSGTDSNNLNSGGGVAFAKGVLERLRHQKLDTNNATDMEDIQKFVELLPIRTDLARGLREYHQNCCDSTFDKTWRLADYNPPLTCSCQELSDTFETVNKPSFVDALKEIIGDMTRDGVAAQQSGFRIMPVGGFSNLCCVDFAIEECLNISPGSLNHDQRLIFLTREQRYYAVAYGAALYAAKVIIKSQESDFEIGFYGYDGENDTKNVLVREGDDMSSFTNIKWLDKQFEVKESINKPLVRFYIQSRDMQSPKEFDLDICSALAGSCRVEFGLQVKNEKYIVNVKATSVTSITKSFEIEEYIKKIRDIGGSK